MQAEQLNDLLAHGGAQTGAASACRKSGDGHFFECFTAFASRSAPAQQKPQGTKARGLSYLAAYLPPKPDGTSRAAALDSPGFFDSLWRRPNRRRPLPGNCSCIFDLPHIAA